MRPAGHEEGRRRLALTISNAQFSKLVKLGRDGRQTPQAVAQGLFEDGYAAACMGGATASAPATAAELPVNHDQAELRRRIEQLGEDLLAGIQRESALRQERADEAALRRLAETELATMMLKHEQARDLGMAFSHDAKEAQAELAALRASATAAAIEAWPVMTAETIGDDPVLIIRQITRERDQAELELLAARDEIALLKETAAPAAAEADPGGTAEALASLNRALAELMAELREMKARQAESAAGEVLIDCHVGELEPLLAPGAVSYVPRDLDIAETQTRIAALAKPKDRPDALSGEELRLVRGLAAAGQSAKEIARERILPIGLVKAAIEGRG